MGKRLKKVLVLVCAVGLVLCAVMSGTFAWNSKQLALNDLFGSKSKLVPVELVKLDKKTEEPIAGTAFYLFREKGTQIGDRYVTDSEGKILVELNAGSYYFEEASPAPGYTYDTDDSGITITQYPFTVTEEQERIVVEAYNQKLKGDLLIRKILENPDDSPLTDLQKETQFEFTVSFSDGKTYLFSIDGGEKIPFASGETILLKHGQTAVFEDLPIGLLYDVVENIPEGYTTASTGHRGNITEEQSVAEFINRPEDSTKPIGCGSITVTKEVIGEGADLTKKFSFVATIGGVTEEFTLAHGESKTFPDIPVGTPYTVEEIPLSEEEEPPADEEPPAEEEPTEEQVPPAEEDPTEEQEPPAQEEPTEGQEPPAQENPTEGQEPPAQEEPTEEQEPPAEEDPTEEQEPPAEEDPTEGQEPPAQENPTEGQEPPAQEEPTEGQEPPAQEDPTEGQEPPAEEEPTEEQEPPAEEDPTEEQEPLAQEDPTEKEEPSGEDQTINAEQLSNEMQPWKVVLLSNLVQLSEEPLSEEPLSEEPLSEEPLSEEPPSEEPSSEEPSSEEPSSEEPSSEEPSSEEYLPAIRKYTGTVSGADVVTLLPFVNSYDPAPDGKVGSITVTKEVVGDGNAEEAFTFELVFEGENAPERQEFVLKDGESKTFDNLPHGISYTLRETDPAGYRPLTDTVSGMIAGGQNVSITMRNKDPLEVPQEDTVKLTVQKLVAGEKPETDRDKEFDFVLAVEGREIKFTLKANEIKTFEIPAGSVYEIREDDCYEEGYSQTIYNGHGVSAGEEVVVLACNTFIGEVTIDIEGIKTWEIGENGTEVLPESITLELKNGDVLVQELIVQPDENGDWKYSFTVPKYASDGSEIIYSLTEQEIASFRATYDDEYNITNTYVPPIEVNPPIITKVVEGEEAPDTTFEFIVRGEDGAPMPEGSTGSKKVITLTGAGEAEIGKIVFTKPGVYVYTVSETNGGEKGWRYDSTVYIFSVTVTEEEGLLSYVQTVETNDSPCENIVFTNRFDRAIAYDKLLVSGTKTWDHGNNPETNRPNAIVVKVYADGQLATQRQITAADEWKYEFELPKFAADGHQIVYTVDEAKVTDYTKQIDGYNLTNTYNGTPIVPDDPDNPDNPDNPDEKVLISGRKTWNHGNNPEENRPNVIVIEVYADGQLAVQRQITADDDWSYSFEQPKFAADGHEIVYTVDEAEVTGYSKQVNGYDLTNTYTGKPDNPDVPGEGKILISGKKTWNHGNNPEANRPDSIVVEVYADGKLAVQRQVTADDEWKYTFELPKFADDGHEFVYTIDEAKVANYSKQIDGYDLINTYSGTPNVPDKPDSPNKPGGPPDQPDTGDNSNVQYWFALMIFSGIGLIVMTVIGFKNRYRPKYVKKF